MVLFEKAYRSKADISGACKAAPASQLPAAAFCRQSGVKQQEQGVSQLLCSVVPTAVRLSGIIWFVLLLLLQQSWGTQLNPLLTPGGGWGNLPEGSEHRDAQVKDRSSRTCPGHCGADHKRGDIKVSHFPGGLHLYPTGRQPQTLRGQ